MNSIKEYQKLTELIEEKLSALDLPDRPGSLYEPVRYTLSLGGKRIRPLLTLSGCGLCKGEVKEAVSAALAVELLHNFTLLHDDIMDAAETRRGEPSVFKKWNASTAILSGDVMFVKALQELQHYRESDEYARIIEIFLASTQQVCEGQALDLEFENRKDVTIDEYIEMIRGKTAALIRGALMLGGAVAGTSKARMDKLGRLGEELGIAFQIQDDLLDVIADPSKFGKKSAGDIMEGKKTYLALLSLELGTSKQAEAVAGVLDSENVTGDQVEQIITIYRDLNIFKKSQQAIEEHYREAMTCLDTFGDSEYKDSLSTLLSGMIKREF